LIFNFSLRLKAEKKKEKNCKSKESCVVYSFELRASILETLPMGGIKRREVYWSSKKGSMCKDWFGAKSTTQRNTTQHNTTQYNTKIAVVVDCYIISKYIYSYVYM